MPTLLLRTALAATLAADVGLSLALLASAARTRPSLFAGWRAADTNADAAVLGLVRVVLVVLALAAAAVPKAHAPGRGTANGAATPDGGAPPASSPAPDRPRRSPPPPSSSTRSGPALALALACQASTAMLDGVQGTGSLCD